MEKNLSNRILAIDLARGISVLMVIVVHVLWIYVNLDTQSNTLLGKAIHFIGKGTGMFLIAMGFSFTLSRNQSIKLSIKRAFYILGVGYLMNLLKFVIPTLIGIMPKEFIEAYGWTAPASTANLFYMFFTGDILQLAGVCLLFMGLINKISKNKYVCLVAALLIIATTKMVHGFQLGIPGIDYVLDVLWGADWNIYFAVFPWFSFILIGMFFGKWYQEKKSTIAALFSKMGICGVLLLLIGSGLCSLNFEYHFGDYFHLGPGGSIYLIGFNLILMWFAYNLESKIKSNAIFQFLYYCSKRVTTLYVIQWILICWGMSIFGYQQLSVIGILLLIPLFTLLTFIIQKYIIDSRIFNKKRASQPVSA